MHPEIVRWARVLAPPVMTRRPASGRGDLHRNMAWVREHLAAHAGEWIALRDGTLLAHGHDRRMVQQIVSKTGAAAGVLLLRLPES